MKGLHSPSKKALDVHSEEMYSLIQVLLVHITEEARRGRYMWSCNDTRSIRRVMVKIKQTDKGEEK